MPRLNLVKDKLLKNQEEFTKLCDRMYLEQLKDKVADVVGRLASTERRLRVCSGAEVSLCLDIFSRKVNAPVCNHVRYS